ncbi:tRNA-guanine transglycosylase [Panus rudis PR-1116 ss-1]|nr:tRNA-guanine transglycosylase [Panus rudis PR-1116 ss-1]
MSALTFSLLPTDLAQFAPRLGSISLHRRDGSFTPEIQTPGFLTTSSRGIVPHLSRDHVHGTQAIRWANIPFESYLERAPPVPTFQAGQNPLHTLLGYQKRHILSLSARDPFDSREMPANSKDYISAYCIRGVRKVTSADWKSYALSCKPDLVTALSDVPYTNQPYSQKRTAKSIERSAAWLADFLRSSPAEDTQSFNVLVNMVGGIDPRARATFAEKLIEPLHGKEQEQVAPLRTLDEGVIGYIVDLLPMRTYLNLERRGPVSHYVSDKNDTEVYTDLAKASLTPLPKGKVRIVYSTTTPHEILRFIRNVGIDVFDSNWAQRAANIGVALDFRFPVPSKEQFSSVPGEPFLPRLRQNGKYDLGHNLFSTDYAHAHTRLAATFLDATSAAGIQDAQVCPCAACSPVSSSTYLAHSAADVEYVPTNETQRPFTRSYLHHLLHTHEMSSHALLVMHNLSVLDAFFAGIRKTLHESQETFEKEAEIFVGTYDESTILFDEAKMQWAKVESERGKGRLAREKQKESGSVDAVPLDIIAPVVGNVV